MGFLTGPDKEKRQKELLKWPGLTLFAELHKAGYTLEACKVILDVAKARREADQEVENEESEG